MRGARTNEHSTRLICPDAPGPPSTSRSIRGVCTVPACRPCGRPLSHPAPQRTRPALSIGQG
eukprot:6174344-Alexandrium_andersonii.AAC.1